MAILLDLLSIAQLKLNLLNIYHKSENNNEKNYEINE